MPADAPLAWLHGLAITAASFAALGRCGGIFVAKLRQLRYRARAVVYPRSWRDRCTQPEPFLLCAVTLGLLATHHASFPVSAGALLVSAGGALLSLAGISLMLWAFLSFPSVSPGHYVLPEQQVVTRGPYARVRHPLYLAALLIWCGVTLSFRSPVALVAMVYVVPAYLIYIRSEEAMLLGHFGAAYERYRSEVGGLLPRLPACRVSPSGGRP